MKHLFRRAANRALHLFARIAPGATTLRPALHRLRGVKIGRGVFIGDDVYIDGEYPECVEIGENASVSIRALLIAHTRGAGRLIIERDAFVGPQVVICCPAGRTLRIGEGAVVSAGAVITRSVNPRTMVASIPPQAIAQLKAPLTRQTTMKDFLAGMEALKLTKREG